jgi:chlorobactene glucosyltransferase
MNFLDSVSPGTLLALLPWAFIALVVPFALKRKPRITQHAPMEDLLARRAPPGAYPLVSIIVPARNEALNIGACVAKLLGSEYPEKEVIVVDDRSDDGTYEIVCAYVERGYGELKVVEGGPLPSGWFGKNWACWQGYLAARGDILLFTDADTRHNPQLIGHSVAALLDQKADLVSLLPLQVLTTFWERLLMPHILTMIGFRYRDLSRINRSTKPRSVIGNGQFMMFPREAYEAIGGHAAVRGSVVEDLRLAQVTRELNRKLYLAHAEEVMETRMYRSLGEIIEGWSKNLSTGAKLTVSPWLAPFVPWVIAIYQLVVWVAPPVALIGWAFGAFDRQIGIWSMAATGLSLLFWLGMCTRLRVLPRFALLYPIGALATGLLFLRSALRGDKVVWKGRAYRSGDFVTD